MKNYFFPGLLIFLCFLSCANSQIPEIDESPLLVRMSPVLLRDNPDEVKGFGSLSFIKKFEVVSALEGVLETLYFREGDSIKQGDLVAVLYNPQVNLAARRAEDAYSQALAALDIAMVRLRDSSFQAEIRLLDNDKARDELNQAEIILEEERRKSLNREALYEAGGLSDEAIREERFRLASMEAQVSFMVRDLEIRRVGLREEDLINAGITVPLEKDELWQAFIYLATAGVRAEAAAARANLEAAAREMESSRLMERELRILSPGPGIVGARYAETGERIKRDDAIITILETESLYAVFTVPESEAHKLEKGMAAFVSSGGDEILQGQVDLVSPQADNQSFTFLVRVLLDPRDNNRLRPGMFARVSIPINSDKQIILIPEAALTARNDNSGKVFTVRHNLLSERDVIFGARRGEEREIISGLSPGEVVILNPSPLHKEGLYVASSE